MHPSTGSTGSVVPAAVAPVTGRPGEVELRFPEPPFRGDRCRKAVSVARDFGNSGNGTVVQHRIRKVEDRLLGAALRMIVRIGNPHTEPLELCRNRPERAGQRIERKREIIGSRKEQHRQLRPRQIVTGVPQLEPLLSQLFRDIRVLEAERRGLLMEESAPVHRNRKAETVIHARRDAGQHAAP